MRPGGAIWLARHEARLSLRDLLSTVRGGLRGRFTVAIVLGAFFVLIHLVAWATVGRHAAQAEAPDPRLLVTVTTAIAFAACLLLSQAIESVTRVLYGRGDLDLILSSPVAAARVVGVRITILALSLGGMTILLAGPFANVLALTGGARWLGIYPAALALGLSMTALGLIVTLGLLRLFGPRRTRLAAQIVAAIIGSAFAIGLQMAAILEFGDMSRFAIMAQDAVLAWVPATDSPVWLPARAAMGDLGAACITLAASLAMLVLTLAVCAPRLALAALASLAAPEAAARSEGGGGIRVAGPGSALRVKEWRLLARDPWLLSQTLMQVLYLLPPALLLWQTYGEGSGRLTILVPILVMTAGQLAGSLGWLAISGEDAPDLVATAPVSLRSVVGAKLMAVLIAVLAIVGPFGLAIAWSSPWIGAVVLVGASVSGLSAFAIQYWFRSRSRRSQFRRRQTASRIATFAEAFSSILWAATAALAAVATELAVLVGAVAVAGLAGAWLLSPRQDD